MFLTVGDAPIAVARYRIITTAEGTVLTEIDRLGILIPYRGQKYANKIIIDILSDSQHYSNNAVSAILLSIPIVSWIQTKLESLGWKVFTSRAIESRGPINFISMIYCPDPS